MPDTNNPKLFGVIKLREINEPSINPFVIPPSSSYTLMIIFCTTPNFFTLTGGDNHIGIEKVSEAISISVSAPTGMVLELNVIPVSST